MKFFNTLGQSLSLRLLGIFVVTALFALAVLILLFSRGLGSQWRGAIEPHLTQYVRYVHRDLGYPPAREQAANIAMSVPLTITVYRNKRRLFATHDNRINPTRAKFRQAPSHGRLKTVLAEQLNTPDSDQTGPPDTHDLAPAVSDVAFGQNHRRPVLRITQGSYEVYYQLLRPRERREHDTQLLVAVALLTGFFALSFLLIRRQLAPLARIQQGVQKMSDGYFDHTIPIVGRDDLSQLGTSINAMATRIQAMLDAKRELLLSISHELRTPITRARVTTDMLAEGTHRVRLQEDLAEMQHLIDEIVESEKLQQPHTVLNRESVDINALVQQAVRERQTHIHVDIPNEPVVALLDEQRIRLLLRNLLNNALLHGAPTNGDPVAITVQLRHSDDMARLQVMDNGPGIDHALLQRVTEPFFRVDASRSRETGGVGLGLTLCRRIAEAHGGRFEISSSADPQSGTTVTVWLPVRP